MTTLDRQLIASRLGLAGSTLGVLAGVVQATAGSHIPAWSGDKSSPVALGLLTVVLSLIAVAAALALGEHARLRPGRRAAAAIGLLIAAGLCFTTVGRLWYIPGVLLLCALGFTLAAGGMSELGPVVRANWARGLISLLGAFEILMAIGAGPVVTIGTGVIGGAALLTAPWLAGRARAATVPLLLIGTLPFAVLTWWSVASPLLAVVALAIGLPATRRARTGNQAGEPTVSPVHPVSG